MTLLSIRNKTNHYATTEGTANDLKTPSGRGCIPIKKAEKQQWSVGLLFGPPCRQVERTSPPLASIIRPPLLCCRWKMLAERCCSSRLPATARAAIVVERRIACRRQRYMMNWRRQLLNPKLTKIGKGGDVGWLSARRLRAVAYDVHNGYGTDGENYQRGKISCLGSRKRSLIA